MKPDKEEPMSARQIQSHDGQKILSRRVISAIGLNDNVEFMGQQLHIQTEKMETPTNCIITQVFCKGRVVLSTKSDFPTDLSNSYDFNTIQNLMRMQHSRMIRDIMRKKTQILSSSNQSTTP